MQAVKETIRCIRCGCIALPDANRCPKCGASYRDPSGNGSREMFIDPFDYLPQTRVDGVVNNVNLDMSITKVIRAYYQLTCPRHGTIHVRATVIGSPVKCPFCE